MTDVEQRLAAELTELGGRAPHDPDLAGSVRRRARRQATVLGSVLAVLVLLGGAGFAVVRLRGPAPNTAASGGPATTAAATCAPLSGSPLPTWAAAGFSDPANPPPHALGRNGLIMAIVFGPLDAQPEPDRSNKVLWAAKLGGDQPGKFTVDARLTGSTRQVHLPLGLAPGPSIVDLPAPGCWQLEARWGDGYRDTVSLQYG